jgi:hypothetical protein
MMRIKTRMNSVRTEFIRFGFAVILLLSTGAEAIDLKSNCTSTAQLIAPYGQYLIDVLVSGADGKSHPHRFLFDTGYSFSSITAKVCQEIGCKIVRKEELNPISKLQVEFATPATIRFAAIDFKLASPQIDASEAVKALKVDGVIGGDIIFHEELIANLRDKYLCFPKTPSHEWTEKLGMTEIPAEYDAGRVWLSFAANKLKFDDYFLDTGSDTTSLLKDDIKKLKLKSLGADHRLSSEHGYHTVENFGPVRIELAGLAHELKYVATASDSEMRKLGTDLLKDYILGFAPNSKFIYVSH